MKRLTYYYILLLLLSFCREPFEVETGYGDAGFLVVDGYINVGDGVTKLNLSRTTSIDDEVIRIAETGATVTIEDGQFAYSLSELENGVYISDELSLPDDRQYRLKITTQDDEVYLSEYVTPVHVPPIDSISWVQDQAGVTIFVTTHDPLNQNMYYRWQFDEVWEQRSSGYTFIEYKNGAFVNRNNEDIKNAYNCWKYESSEAINIASTTELSENTIVLKPVTSISQLDERMAVRYSILVKQHGLSKDAFQFFQILLKNNENLGTFSDPQPSQLPTNIRCITADKIVVGFISASNTVTSRLLIDRSELIRWGFQLQCLPLRLGLDSAQRYMQWYTPTSFITDLGDPPVQIGVNAVLHPCADCRRRGGTNMKPTFWDITEQ